MIEQLVYMKLNQSGSNVLLYTLNEPYNGRDDFLKIYAAEFDDNNVAKVTKMSDELHNEVKGAISNLANGNLSNITILDGANLNTENLQGKAYAIPIQFKDAIKKQSIKLNNINNQNNLVNAQQGISEVNEPAIADQTIENESSINAFNNDTENAEDTFQNNASVVTGEPISSPVVQKTEHSLETKDDNMVAPTSSLLADESYDITQAVSTTEPKENIMVPVNEVSELSGEIKADTKERSECPSIEDLENSISIIKRYIDFQKNKEKVETNNSITNSETLNNEVSVNEPSVHETVPEKQPLSDTTASNYSEPIINQPVFPSFSEADQSFFVEKKDDVPLEQSYVASPNVPQEEPPVQAFNNNQPDPVVMPDNFVGKNDNNFSMEGLSPSTLNSDANIFKFVA